MKTLPTLREKKRYLAFEAKAEQALTRQELMKEILNSTYSLFGDVGCCEIAPMLVSYNGKYGILRCSREKTTEARAALACINNIKGARVSILVLGISGTIKGAMEKFIQKTSIKDLEQRREK